MNEDAKDEKPTGYCPCCGAPRYGELKPVCYSDCVWSDPDDNLGPS